MTKLVYFYPGHKDNIVNVGVNESHYYGEGCGIMNCRHGVKWQYESSKCSKWISKLFCGKKRLIKRSIELFEEDVTIMAYPSPDYKFIITVYGFHSKLFPPPSNAVVYNLDGSVHKILTPPIVINKDIWGYKAVKGEYFDNINWDIKEGKIILYLTLAVRNTSWVEARELNPETGKFTEDWTKKWRW